MQLYGSVRTGPHPDVYGIFFYVPSNVQTQVFQAWGSLGELGTWT